MYDKLTRARSGDPVTHLYFAYGSNLDGAQMRRVYVYVKEDPEHAVPTEAYFGVLWRAYHHHGFDAYPLAMALGGDE